MKKTNSNAKRVRELGADDIIPEYDFSKARRNPYAARAAKGSNLVLLDPDVAKEFPDSASVNEALRALTLIIRRGKRSRRAR